jgi:release factor glutamine methyltransferase
VCNPPYICSSEIAGLDVEVRAFDPCLALDGGEDGLEAFRTILSQALGMLRTEGFLIFETGYRQAQTVRDMMVEAWLGAGRVEAQVLADLSGKARAVAGRRQSVGGDAKSKKKVGNPVLSG